MQGNGLDSPEFLGYVDCDFYPVDLHFSPYPSMHLRRVTYLLIVAGVTLWCGGFLAAPLCSSMGGNSTQVGNALYQVYQPICHQIPERSLFLDGFQFGVCSRCSAIYLSFLLGTLFYPLVRNLNVSVVPPRWIIVLAALPMLVDATWIGPQFYDVTLLTRSLTGGLFGLSLPFVLLPVAFQAIEELFVSLRSHQQKGLSNAE
jgi:uncharacterized membrane protein